MCRAACARRHAIARLALVFAAIGVAAVADADRAAAIALKRFDASNGARRRLEPAGRAVPGMIRVTRGVQFSKADGVPLSLDVYRPPADGRVSGPHADLRRLMAERGARQPGVVLALLRRTRLRCRGHRLSPCAGMEVARADRRRAERAVLDLAAAPKFDGDPSRIVVVGRSAGAQLAMRLAYQEGPSSIRGVVNYYGPVDLADGWRHPPDRIRRTSAASSRRSSAERRIRSRNITAHASPIT